MASYNLNMNPYSWTIRSLRTALAEGKLRPSALAVEALERANGNASRNTYLWRDPAWTLAEAAHAEAMPRCEGGPFGDGREALWGVPISVKDCFDLAGAPTSCGVQFYRDLNGVAREDSWLVETLRTAGAVITGKTHLHPLAYGITGENPEFGDCVQPSDASALTGGSSSGAAASVLEGSAAAAIGTDTGGSVRAPASLCRLVGYRATIGRGDWRGAGHLAQSFDTMGWLFRDLEDAPLFAAPYAPSNPEPPAPLTRFAIIHDDFLHDCELSIVDALHSVAAELITLGLKGSRFDAAWWAESYEIFSPIQAWEAARIHEGHYARFEPTIRARLECGARMTDDEIATLRARHAEFRTRVDALLAEHELLLLPATPVARFAAGEDQIQTRARVLRYTTPFSLAGVPVVTVPCSTAGMQLATRRGTDEALLDLAARLGAYRSTRRA